MKLKCPSCGSCHTVIKDADELETMTGNSAFTRLSSGFVDPGTVATVLEFLVRIITLLIGYAERAKKSHSPVLVCCDCGYFSRL